MPLKFKSCTAGQTDGNKGAKYRQANGAHQALLHRTPVAEARGAEICALRLFPFEEAQAPSKGRRNRRKDLKAVQLFTCNI